MSVAGGATDSVGNEIIEEIRDFVSRRLRVIADVGSEDKLGELEQLPFSPLKEVRSAREKVSSILLARLICAAMDDDEFAIRAAVDNIANTDTQPVPLARRPYSLLHYAAVAPSARSIETLLLSEGVLQKLAPLDANATCNSRTTQATGVTPLHIAGMRGYPDIARVLLVSGGNPRVARDKGVSVFHDVVNCAVLDAERTPLVYDDPSHLSQVQSFRREMRSAVEKIALGKSSAQSATRRQTIAMQRVARAMSIFSAMGVSRPTDRGRKASSNFSRKSSQRQQHQQEESQQHSVKVLPMKRSKERAPPALAGFSTPCADSSQPKHPQQWNLVKAQDNLYLQVSLLLAKHGADVNISAVGDTIFDHRHQAMMHRVRELVGSERERGSSPNAARSNSWGPKGIRGEERRKKKGHDTRSRLLGRAQTDPLSEGKGRNGEIDDASSPPGTQQGERLPPIEDKKYREAQGATEILHKRRLYDAARPSYETKISDILFKRTEDSHAERRQELLRNMVGMKSAALPHIVLGDYVIVSANFRPRLLGLKTLMEDAAVVPRVHNEESPWRKQPASSGSPSKSESGVPSANFTSGLHVGVPTVVVGEVIFSPSEAFSFASNSIGDGNAPTRIPVLGVRVESRFGSVDGNTLEGKEIFPLFQPAGEDEIEDAPTYVMLVPANYLAVVQKPTDIEIIRHRLKRDELDLLKRAQRRALLTTTMAIDAHQRVDKSPSHSPSGAKKKYL